MAERPGRVYTRQMLLGVDLGRLGLTAIRGRSTSMSATYARSSSGTRASPELILTVRGVGYRFRDA